MISIFRRKWSQVKSHLLDLFSIEDPPFYRNCTSKNRPKQSHVRTFLMTGTMPSNLKGEFAEAPSIYTACWSTISKFGNRSSGHDVIHDNSCFMWFHVDVLQWLSTSPGSPWHVSPCGSPCGIPGNADGWGVTFSLWFDAPRVLPALLP